MHTTAPTDPRRVGLLEDPDGRTRRVSFRTPRTPFLAAPRNGGWPRAASIGLRLLVGTVSAGPCFGCDASVNVSLLPLTSDDSTTTPTPSVDDSEVDATATTVRPDAAIATSESVAASSTDGSEDAGSVAETALLHHYDFVGDGTLVPDLVGDADGMVVGGAVLDATGALELDGLDDYVDLPNGLLSSLDAATVTLWVEWRGGICWQRLFDFGSSATSEDTVSSAETSLFVTPASCRASHLGPVEHNVLSLMFHAPGNYSIAQDVNPLPIDQQVFVALSAGGDGTITLSLNAVTVVQLDSALRLSDLDDVNNWIGRSQWGQDPTLRAAIYDFRIYGAALTGQQVQRLYEQPQSDI